MSGKFTTILVVLIVIFIGGSYIYVINNPIEISIQATIGSTEHSTSSSTTTTTNPTTTTTTKTKSTTTKNMQKICFYSVRQNCEPQPRICEAKPETVEPPSPKTSKFNGENSKVPLRNPKVTLWKGLPGPGRAWEGK